MLKIKEGLWMQLDIRIKVSATGLCKYSVDKNIIDLNTLILQFSVHDIKKKKKIKKNSNLKI